MIAISDTVMLTDPRASVEGSQEHARIFIVSTYGTQYIIRFTSNTHYDDVVRTQKWIIRERHKQRLEETQAVPVSVWPPPSAREMQQYIRDVSAWVGS